MDFKHANKYDTLIYGLVLCITAPNEECSKRALELLPNCSPKQLDRAKALVAGIQELYLTNYEVE